MDQLRMEDLRREEIIEKEKLERQREEEKMEKLRAEEYQLKQDIKRLKNMEEAKRNAEEMRKKQGQVHFVPVCRVNCKT